MNQRLDLSATRPRIHDFTLDLTERAAPLDFATLFATAAPVEVEIGCGKGRFLLHSALAHPERNYLGLDVRVLRAAYSALRIAKRELRNVKIAHIGVRAFFERCVAPGALHAVHLYFPDPWWKNRHRKRRVWTAELFLRYRDALTPGGRLFIASDVAAVFDGMRALARATPGLAEQAHVEDAAPGCTTNFEDKALRAGRTVQRAAFVRTNDP